MNTLVMFFALICGAVAQAVLPSWTWLGTARPPVLLAVVLYYALTRERDQVLMAALLAGLMQDALSLIPLGYSSCLFILVALAVGRFKDMIFVFRAVTHLVLGALGNAAVAVGLACLLAFNGQIQLNAQWLVSRTLGALLVGALVAPLVFKGIESLDVHLGNMEGSRA